MSTLYVIDVWPGSWADVTRRARRVLNEVVLIVTPCVSSVREGLEMHDIPVPLTEVNELHLPSALPVLLGALSRGDVAWVSVGREHWPGPARPLTQALLERGVDLVPIPGPAVPIAALALSGMPADRFTYLGALPPLPARRCAALQAVSTVSHTLLCSVTACELDGALQDIVATLGDRRIAICQGDRVWRGRVGQVPVLDWEEDCVLVIEAVPADVAWTEARVRGVVRSMLDAGRSPRDVAREVAHRSGWPRRKVYAIVVEGEPCP